MYRNLFSVGGFTLLSRGAGFFRDVLLGAILGAGLLDDAFVVAQRLPNHFRAIFGEGAWNAALCQPIRMFCTAKAFDGARRFAGQIFIGLLVCSSCCWRSPSPSRRASSICSRRDFANIRTNSRSP